MTKKNVIAQDPIGDGVGARKLKVRFSLSRTGQYAWSKYLNTKPHIFQQKRVYTMIQFDKWEKGNIELKLRPSCIKFHIWKKKNYSCMHVTSIPHDPIVVRTQLSLYGYNLGTFSSTFVYCIYKDHETKILFFCFFCCCYVLVFILFFK